MTETRDGFGGAEEYNKSSMAKHEKYPAGVMVFAAIGPNFKSELVIIEGTVNAESYRGVIEQFGRRGWFFMQDGATAHTTEANIRWLLCWCNLLPFWPANSPDFNPIESFWGKMKKLLKRRPIHTLPELKA